ncbi:hypothetical protein [Francisella sp. SYW-9]|uniref:hypothetical protein n=1 Tax=Francisella sp. SYW-9 TaxID=2610888 RepID=UPI00123DBAB4|nr:hypothetical protein [Francisella sp. SYW-9]
MAKLTLALNNYKGLIAHSTENSEKSSEKKVSYTFEHDLKTKIKSYQQNSLEKFNELNCAFKRKNDS